MTAPGLRPDTRFSGKCPGCGKLVHYRPLAPRGGSQAYAPTSAQMNVTCGRCGGKVTLDADVGQSITQPLILGSRDELDLTGLRAHVNEMHRHARIRGVPRSNRDLAVWHWAQHHRFHQDHHHFGPFVLIKDSRGHTTGQITRPLGWWTGQDAKTRAELDAEWRARHPVSDS